MNEESITIRVLVTLQSSILMPTVCLSISIYIMGGLAKGGMLPSLQDIK